MILGRHDSWPAAAAPLTMDINGAPHAAVQEEHDYMVRGLALARLCPTGSLDVVVTCMDGSKVECTIRAQGSAPALRRVVIYIRGGPRRSRGRSAIDGVGEEGALIIIQSLHGYRPAPCAAAVVVVVVLHFVRRARHGRRGRPPASPGAPSGRA